MPTSSKNRTPWIDWLRHSSERETVLERYLALANTHGLAEAYGQIQEEFPVDSEQNVAGLAVLEDDDPVEIELPVSGLEHRSPAEHLRQTQLDIRWALDNLGKAEAVKKAPNGASRAYLEMGETGKVKELTDLLMKVGDKIVAADDHDATIMEDQRRDMALISKLQAVMQPKAQQQIDDLIRTHPKLVLSRMQRAGYAVTDAMLQETQHQ